MPVENTKMYGIVPVEKKKKNTSMPAYGRTVIDVILFQYGFIDTKTRFVVLFIIIRNYRTLDGEPAERCCN